MRRSMQVTVLWLVVLAISAPATAETPVEGVTVSPDITIDLNGTTVDDDAAADDEFTGTVNAVSLGGAVPAAADLNAYAVASNGDLLLSFDITVDLGDVVAAPSDVVRFDGSTFSIEFDGSAEGIPAGAVIDAVTRDGDDLVLSFDVSVDLGSEVADDEDLVRNDGNALSLFFDASDAGIAGALDLDAADILPNGKLLVSFDGSGSVDAISFSDDDILEVNVDGSGWELAYQPTAQFATWAPADLNALAAINDEDSDGVPDNRDNCLGVFNPALGTLGQPARETFQTTTGGQLDDDADGFGNLCDAKFGTGGLVVGGTDILEQLSSFNKARSGTDCGSTGDQICAQFDHDNAGQFLSGTDLSITRQLFNAPPGPKCNACPTECIGPNC